MLTNYHRTRPMYCLWDGSSWRLQSLLLCSGCLHSCISSSPSRSLSLLSLLVVGPAVVGWLTLENTSSHTGLNRRRAVSNPSGPFWQSNRYSRPLHSVVGQLYGGEEEASTGVLTQQGENGGVASTTRLELIQLKLLIDQPTDLKPNGVLSPQGGTRSVGAAESKKSITPKVFQQASSMWCLAKIKNNNN